MTVVDAVTGSVIPGVTLTRDGSAVDTDANGQVDIQPAWSSLKARAPGYARQNLEAVHQSSDANTIRLKPFKPRALYLSVHGIGSRTLRNAALETVRRNQLNALVIDVKGDRGHIPFKVDLPMARDIGAQDVITVLNMRALLKELHAQGLYLIARIVVFKDDLLAAAKPEWQVRTGNGKTYIDNENLRWIDPFQEPAWDYTLSIARLAADIGFDEIQFDYVRFPATSRAAYSEPSTEASRTRAITQFLVAARDVLMPYNVHLAADVFGYALWNTNDTDVGQKLKPILDAVDIVSPMLYPSGFHLGIPGHLNPVQNIYDIIFKSLKRGIERTGVSPLRFRPWLQAFKDYAFDRQLFGPRRMREQIRASEDFGANGWMFWNPRNVYPLDFALKNR